MKKFFTFSAALLLGVCAFAGLRQTNVKVANADDTPADSNVVANLLRDARKVGDDAVGYVKKTQIFLKTEAVEDIETHFHAGVPSLKRTTYYNADETALLMGDYDGGFESINSGYKNSGENAIHFTAKDGVTAENMFNDAQHNDGWTAVGQNVGSYYQTLTTLADSAVSTTWDTFSNGDYTTYRHRVGALTATNGAYDDNALNAFQYFVAPMLLRDNYISYDSIWVTQAPSFLSLRLYASTSDEGKVTVKAGDNEVLVAEARVYKGLSLNPGKMMLKGSFDWLVGQEMTLDFDAYNPEKQYTVSKQLSAGDELKVYDADSDAYKGFAELETGCRGWFEATNPDDNIKAKISCKVDVFWKPSTNSLWISIDEETSVKYTINTTSTWNILDANAKFSAYVWGGSYGDPGQFLEITHKTGTGTADVFEVTTNITAEHIIVVRINPDASEPSWADGVKWGQTNNVDLVAGTLSYNINWHNS